MIERTNLTIRVEGQSVIIIIEDFDFTSGSSKSGKSETVATTSGNVEIPETDGLIIGLNAYRKTGK